jgi:mannose/cellobiose epimerase-like protein (N-acyl-D-glucosamine 2-epimerase family)
VTLIAFLESDLRSTHGGFIKAIPSILPRRQNPHMHPFKAIIATFDATGDLAYQSRVGQSFLRFVANLCDPPRQDLGEYFEDDWSKIEPVIVEPSYQAEWVWALSELRLPD